MLQLVLCLCFKCYPSCNRGLTADVASTNVLYYVPGKSVRNSYNSRLLQLLRALTLYQSLHGILFVIARWRHYW